MNKRTKHMNVMKHLARRIVHLYIHRALMQHDVAIGAFVQVCSQSEGVQGYTHLNAHAKFIARFYAWWNKIADRPVSDMMDLMDDFFEKEDYLWEDLIEYS